MQLSFQVHADELNRPEVDFHKRSQFDSSYREYDNEQQVKGKYWQDFECLGNFVSKLLLQWPLFDGVGWWGGDCTQELNSELQKAKKIVSLESDLDDPLFCQQKNLIFVLNCRYVHFHIDKEIQEVEIANFEDKLCLCIYKDDVLTKTKQKDTISNWVKCLKDEKEQTQKESIEN